MDGIVFWIFEVTMLFHIAYCQSCGGNIRDISGTFSPPDDNNDGTYDPDTECLWRLIARENKVVVLDIPEIDVACEFDYVEIHDGNHLVGRYCSSGPVSVTSTSPVISVQFSSGSVVEAGRGFNATYQQIPDVLCGYTAAYLAGTIRSVDTDRDGFYDPDSVCIWVITPVYPNQLIQVFVEEMDIQNTFRCGSDHLKVHDLDVMMRMREYCGEFPPPIMTTNQSRVFITFQTDSLINRRGFTVFYAYTDNSMACGGIFKEPEGSFGSVTKATDDNGAAHCVWVIVAPKDKIVSLSFPTFNLTLHETCRNCYLSLYDGYYSYPFEVAKGKYCGNSITPVFFSLTNVLFVEYFCESFSSSNFEARFSIVDATIWPPCGELSTDDFGVIRSPDLDFNGFYDTNRLCRWTIFSKEQYNIKLNVFKFDLQDDYECYYDYLEIYDGLSLIGKYCGSMEVPYMISNSRLVTLVFSSDDNVNGEGILALYQQIEDTACGHLTAFLAGYVKSFTNDEGVYENDAFCIWNINTPSSGILIQVYVVKMDIEESPDCLKDNLQIYDNGVSLAFARHCGSTPPPLQTSVADTVYVVFRTDSLYVGQGFTAIYAYTNETTGCGGILDDNEGMIQSTEEMRGELCVWVIVAPGRSTIDLAISNVDLDSSDTCGRSYIKVFDGYGSYPINGSMGTYCEHNIPDIIHSTSNILFVEVFFDIVARSNQMQISYQEVISGQPTTVVVTTDVVTTEVATTGTSIGSTTTAFLHEVYPCGGILSETIGIIHSPDLDGDGVYDPDDRCEWYIIASKNQVVDLTVHVIEIEYGDEDCQNDYLKIIDGETVYGKYCTSDFDLHFRSETNVVFIQFVSNPLVAYGGFEGNYTLVNNPACGYYTTLRAGSIVLHDRMFTVGRACYWKVMSIDTNALIQLYVISMNIQYTENCELDYLQTRDMVMTKYCGSNRPPLLSWDSPLFIRFESNTNMPGTGFSAVYAMTYDGGERGGVLIESTGNLASTWIYRTNQDYVWVLVAPDGHLIQIEFSRFHIEYYYMCKHDYIKVYDGLNSYPLDGVVGQYCGEVKPPLILSKSNVLYVEFHSDNENVARGFTATFHHIGNSTEQPTTNERTETTTSFYEGYPCGGILRATTGIIHSPDIDRDGLYDHSSNCEWYILADQQQVVELNVHIIKIETTNECQYDYLKIIDGDTVYGKYCNSNFDLHILSQTRVVHIIFVSDETIAHVGFEGDYSLIEDLTCGYHMVSRAGSVILHDTIYTAGVPCSWKIISPDSDKIIEFFVINMIIQLSENCESDYLKVYEADDLLNTKYCGSSTPPLISSPGPMLIEFVSNSNMEGAGFKAVYALTEKLSARGGVRTHSTGSLGTQRFYRENTTYVWAVVAPEGTLIKLDFLMFSLETSEECQNDYVKVYDGFNSYPFDGLVGVYCGQRIPPPPSINSTSNILFVELHSDETTGDRGFEATYHHIGNPTGEVTETTTSFQEGYPCGGILRATTGIIHSPDIDRDGLYDHSSNCEWYILAGEQQVVELNVHIIKIETTNDCNYDYLKIIDGDTVYGKYCNSNSDLHILSQTRVVHIIFASDETIAHVGFEGNYSLIEDLTCGYQMVSRAGSVIVHDTMYTTGAPCSWKIISPDTDKMIEFFVINMITQFSENCESDYLKVYEADDLLNIKYCGSSTPPLISSPGPMLIEFVSNSNMEGAGFKAVYALTDKESARGGVRTHSIGSLGTKTLYQENKSHVWAVVAPEGTLIKLNFLTFSLELSVECQKDYVKVYDGYNSYPFDGLVGVYCGRSIPPQPSINSTSNILFVEFHSDETTRDIGFEATYDHIVAADDSTTETVEPTTKTSEVTDQTMELSTETDADPTTVTETTAGFTMGQSSFTASIAPTAHTSTISATGVNASTESSKAPSVATQGLLGRMKFTVVALLAALSMHVIK